MSEKRFKLDFDNCSQGCIMDRQDKYGQYCKLYDFGKVGRQQIVDLLNNLNDGLVEQQDTIQELEKRLEHYTKVEAMNGDGRMAEYDLGKIDGLDDYIEKQLAEKDKIIGEQQSTITKLKELNDDKGKRIISLIRTNKTLKEENDKLRELIKGNVFGRYREGSLADLEFKAIAYDDIVKLEISNESEPKVIVICRQGKKENVKSFCQMFIPFGVYYEIKEMIE